MAQSQIIRKLRDKEALSRVSAILSQEQFDSRSALGRRVCNEFSFFDAAGRPRLAGCMKALGVLAESTPGLVLPAPQKPVFRSGPRLAASDIPEAVGVPQHPAQIEGLRIELVSKRDNRIVWNTLIAREHPHGITTFAGCQLRYLVGSGSWLVGGGRVQCSRPQGGCT